MAQEEETASLMARRWFRKQLLKEIEGKRRYELRGNTVLVAKVADNGFGWVHVTTLRGEAAKKIITQHKLTQKNSFIEVRGNE